MRLTNTIPIICVMLLMLSACSKQQSETTSATDGAPMYATIDEAMMVAKATEKPVAVNFYADW